MAPAMVKVACFGLAAVLSVCALSNRSKALAQEKGDAYDAFNRFCIENFGAEKEELTYTFAGKELKFIEDGQWVYASERSAAIGFETNLPAKTQIQYGPTRAYGWTTSPPERHFCVHLHYLKNLTPDTEYRYRLLAVDERGNRITSPHMTFRTKRMPDAIRIPEALPGPPYVLDKEGATYLVTSVLEADGTAFEVKASGVTLDLGGHTVIYDDKKWGPIQSGSFWDWINGAKYGVRMLKGAGLKVFNGTIRQGAGSDGAHGTSIGYNAMYLKGGSGMEIAGLRIIYSGPQQIGIYNHWGGNHSEFHHNVFQDLGTEITNRHGAGSRALIFYGSTNLTGIKVHHNLVKRTRQGGLGGNEVYHNEVCMDSWATNSFGIGVAGGGKAYGNRVVGGGYHVCAFGWGNQITGYGNFVHLQAEMFGETRFAEYGKAASVNALRLTQYSGSKRVMHDNLYYDNVFIIKSKDGRQTRGVQVFSDPYVKNYVFRNNVVKIVALDEKTANGACVVTQGNPSRTPGMLPVYYRNSTFLSNVCNVKFGDDYGVGSNHHFEGCKFVKVGDHPKYRTFWFGSGYPCKNAKVSVKDKTGKEVFSGAADAKGIVNAPLVQYVRKMTGKTEMTPHTVTVEGRGTRAVTMDRRREITL